MRMMKRLAVVIGLVLAFAMMAAPGALAVPNSSVVVEDTAGVLDRAQLDRGLSSIGFYVPVKVAIYTRQGAAADDLTEETLSFARQKHPEWLSADGQKWANGLFIFTLDPGGRQVGTFFGDDVKISADQQKHIQASTKKLLRDAQWTDGTIQGVKSAASFIARPWYRAPRLYWGAGIVVVLAAVGLGVAAGVRNRNRRNFALAMANGDKSYTSVSLDVAATELNASAIPDHSSYGLKILAQWRSFKSQFRQVTESKSRLELLTAKQRSKAVNVRMAREYERAIFELDGLDAAIADANALLNHSANWRQAWQQQSEMLGRELDGVSKMLAESKTAGSSATAVALSTQAAEFRLKLVQWGDGLADLSLSPDQALDRLKLGRETMAALLDNHVEAVVRLNTKSLKDAELMRGKIEVSRRNAAVARRRSGSIIDVSYPNLPYFSILAFSTGFNSGQSAVLNK